MKINKIDEAYKVLVSDGRYLSFIRKDYFKRIWDKGLVLLEEKDNEIIGVLTYLIYKVNNKRFYGSKGDIQIREMGVRKDFQRKGIGTKLVNRILDLAKEIKSAQVVLGVRKDNVNAVSFYDKNGFKLKRGITWEQLGKPLPGFILSLEV